MQNSFKKYDYEDYKVTKNITVREKYIDILRKNGVKIRFSILMVIAVILCITALCAEYIVPHDPYAQNLSNALMHPNKEYIFGTDRYGRCIFSRVLCGAKVTMFSSIGLVAVITFAGTIIGTISGVSGGKADEIIMRISDIFLAFPGMVFAIAAAGILGGGLLNAVISLAIISWPKYARLSRGLVLSMKNSQYIAASRFAGCSELQIIFKHVLPNICRVIIITSALDIGVIILELSGLSFLGLGASPPQPEWGAMMSDGRSMLQSAPWTILAPGFAIFMTVSIFNMLGDTLRDFISREF